MVLTCWSKTKLRWKQVTSNLTFHLCMSLTTRYQAEKLSRVLLSPLLTHLPIAIIEADSKEKENNPHYKSFDWELFKNLYNYRASLRARGVATQGNEVYEPIFQGAIVIAQNNPIIGHEAIMQRICQLFFSKKFNNDKTLAAARKLETIPLENLSQFILRAVMSEKETMQIIKERVHKYEAEIMSCGHVNVQRLALNHAQIRAMADALAPLIGMTDEQLQQVHATLIQMAGKRQVSINLDSEIVQQFWDMYEYIHRPGNNMEKELNHSKKPEETIAINLNHFYEKARQFNQPMPDMSELKKALRDSKYYKFLTYKTVESAISQRTVRCYVFQTPSRPKSL